MKRKTTTAKINDAVTTNLLTVTRTECYHKTSRQSGIFADCIGWYFEKVYKTNQYIIECCRLDGGAENIITVYLRANDGVKREDIEKVLLIKEEDQKQWRTDIKILQKQKEKK